MKKRPEQDRRKIEDLNSYRKKMEQRKQSASASKSSSKKTSKKKKESSSRGTIPTGGYTYGKSGSSLTGETQKKTKKISSSRKIKRPTFNAAMHKITWAIGLMGIVLGILLIGYMYRYSTISAIKYENNQLKKDLEAMENQKRELMMEIEKSKRSDVIEQMAKEQLGMQYPEEEQIVYITTD